MAVKLEVELRDTVGGRRENRGTLSAEKGRTYVRST